MLVSSLIHEKTIEAVCFLTKQCCYKLKKVLIETMKIEKAIFYSSQFIYEDIMMNMNLLEIVTPQSIYHSLSQLDTLEICNSYGKLSNKIW